MLTLCLRRLYNTRPTPGVPMPPCTVKVRPYEALDVDTVKAIRACKLAPLLTYYTEPLLIHQGSMQWLFDYTGRRYLDLFGGISTVSVGHCHPEVTKAAAKQSEFLWHASNYFLHPNIHTYGDKLLEKMPGDLKRIYFVNSGSEANDLAVFLSRMHTGNDEVLTLRNSYHGSTVTAMQLNAMGCYKFPMQQGVQHVMNPDPYHGIWGGQNCRDSIVQAKRICTCEGDSCDATDCYYTQLEEQFRCDLPHRRVAAFIVESIQGHGGIVQYTKGYMQKACNLVRANGGLFVMDEMETGLGRTGTHFWGFESLGVIPDIVTLGKSMGNGFPMAAVVTTAKIAECFKQSNHLNISGGSAMATAIGLEVLNVIEKDKMQQNSLEVGSYMLTKLGALRDDCAHIGDVRGKGLMIGVELVDNLPLNEGSPAPTPMASVSFVNILDDCKNMGLIVGRGGVYNNVLRIHPPMCVTKDDVDFAVSVIKAALELHEVRLQHTRK